jgi:hypothetical protein
MKQFYKELNNPQKEKRFFYRFYRIGKDSIAAWYNRHNKLLKHAGVGGKSHLLEKGHIQWNRKGRW